MDTQSKLPEQVKPVNLKKITNKEFKKVFGPKVFWPSKDRGTYNAGIKARKRLKQAGNNV